MAHCQSSEVLIVGGVGCNLRLQEMMATMVGAAQCTPQRARCRSHSPDGGIRNRADSLMFCPNMGVVKRAILLVLLK